MSYVTDEELHKLVKSARLPNDVAVRLAALLAGGGGAPAAHTHPQSDVTDLTASLAAKVDTGRTIATTAPLTGGGTLASDRTLAVSTFASGTSGIVPASGGGTANFLRADGTWTSPGAATFSGVSAWKTAAISSTTNTWTLLTADNEGFDTDNYHSLVTNTSRFTVPTTAYYLLIGRVAWASNTTGRRGIMWRKNAAGNVASGTQLAAFSGANTDTTATTCVLECTVIASLAAGDYVEVFAIQDSGGALDVSTSASAPLQIARLGS